MVPSDMNKFNLHQYHQTHTTTQIIPIVKVKYNFIQGEKD